MFALALLPQSMLVLEPAIAANDQCTEGEIRAGLCDPPPATGDINGGGVDVSAGVDTGSNGTSNEDDVTGESNYGDAAPGGNTATVGGPPPIDREDYVVNCIPNSPCDPNFTVRISDLVNFTPATASTGMEPNGWMVVGLPANFMATAEIHVRSGLLLGFPAEVRFTPVSYSWNFGDGTTLSSASGGSPWAAQSLAEFSDTSTSHRYAASATFVIVSGVTYTAEYRFAEQGWRTIAGTLSVTAEPFSAVAGQAKTVLVNDGCQADSRGPGC
ncbi:hypothetical protein [Leifsonia kafniensis]